MGVAMGEALSAALWVGVAAVALAMMMSPLVIWFLQ
jgi:hypothetical protein